MISMNKRLLKLEKHLIQTSPRRKRNHKQHDNILRGSTQVTCPAYLKRFEELKDPKYYSFFLIYKRHGGPVEKKVNKNPYVFWEYISEIIKVLNLLSQEQEIKMR